MKARGRTRLAAIVTAAVVLVSTGCGDTSSDTATSPTPGATTVSSSADHSATPQNTGSPATDDHAASPTATPEPVPTDRLPLHAPPVAAALTVTDIRVGEHAGFDRVVVEFGGSGIPGYELAFTDDPRQDGSGAPVAVPGRSVIRLVINGVRYPEDSGVPEFTGPNPVPGVGQITQVNWFGVFEGQQRLFVGVDADQPAVRVSTLTSPTRLVLDVAR